ncbi:MAG: hypothetical protein QOJ27_1611 [Sphingomonadales bacterium]|nr:hypothetical protein [Sphingomonadales bacterium]
MESTNEPGPTAEDGEPPDDPLERLGKRVTTGLIVAAGIVGLAIYARPAPPRFDAFAVGGQIVRVDMKTGTIIACEGQQSCQLVLKRGQHLQRIRRSDALPRPAPPTPLPAAPAAGK